MTNNITDKFKNSLKILKDEHRQAYICYTIWKGLYKSRDEYLDELNSSYVFFINTQYAHLNTASMSTAKIFDTRNDIHLVKLINSAEQNKAIFKRIIEDDQIVLHKKFITDNDEIIKNLLTIRDKYLAHIDKLQLNQSIDDILNEYPITPLQLESLILYADEVLIYYSNKFYDQDIGTIIRENEDDYLKVLEAIRFKLQTK